MRSYTLQQTNRCDVIFHPSLFRLILHHSKLIPADCQRIGILFRSCLKPSLDRRVLRITPRHMDTRPTQKAEFDNLTKSIAQVTALTFSP
jgi:hypothetical protein